MYCHAHFVHIVVGARCGKPSPLGEGEGEGEKASRSASAGSVSICGGSFNHLHRRLAAKEQAGEHGSRASAISSWD